eukprot:11582666-Alexandrium_andersonii.AAC.1
MKEQIRTQKQIRSPFAFLLLELLVWWEFRELRGPRTWSSQFSELRNHHIESSPKFMEEQIGGV